MSLDSKVPGHLKGKGMLSRITEKQWCELGQSHEKQDIQLPHFEAMLNILHCTFNALRKIKVWKFPGEGSKRSYSCQPMPQPQQCQIQATVAVHTVARGNTRSLTHCEGPGIEPASSWILVRFISAEPRREA